MLQVHSHVMHMHPDFILHQRDNTLKVILQHKMWKKFGFQAISAVYRQFSAPIFRSAWQYAWFCSGYVDTRLPPFSTPSEYCLSVPSNAMCSSPNCPNLSYMRCAWCTHTFCFPCYIPEYHIC